MKHIFFVVFACLFLPACGRDNAAAQFASFLDKDASCDEFITSRDYKDQPADTALCKLDGKRFFCAAPLNGNPPSCTEFGPKKPEAPTASTAEKPAAVPTDAGVGSGSAK
jgi:hypothetical protein